MESKLIGKKVIITNRDHYLFGEWGIVKYYDGERYHVAPWNGDEELVFDRDEFRVRRDK